MNGLGESEVPCEILENRFVQDDGPRVLYRIVANTSLKVRFSSSQIPALRG